MVYVFFGPPGSGKGTQAQSLSKELDINYIATGNLLRAEIESGSAIGNKVKSIVEAGSFPSDELVLEVFEKKFSECVDKPVILDGFPRTLNQAEKLDELLKKYGQSIEAVFEFQIPEDALLERILGRFTCKGCGAAYHKVFNRPKVEGICDFCGSTDFQVRADDQENVLKNRIALYYLETLPILSYYKAKGNLFAIDATLSPVEVGEQIVKIINHRNEKGEQKWLV